MNKLLSVLLGIMSINVYAQDTLCVMITLDEVLYFDYHTSEITSQFDHIGSYEFTVDSGYVMCVDFEDEKRRFRDVTTTFDDGSHNHDTFATKSHYIYSGGDWGDITIEISEPRKRK
jgi:hypothetical protein